MNCNTTPPNKLPLAHFDTLLLLQNKLINILLIQIFSCTRARVCVSVCVRAYIHTHTDDMLTCSLARPPALPQKHKFSNPRPDQRQRQLLIEEFNLIINILKGLCFFFLHTYMLTYTVLKFI